MSSSFGIKIKITLFGQSHSTAIGVVIDGLPAGESIDLERVQRFMERRAPGRNTYSTTRKEADLPKILSGIFQGKTCGAPLCAIIENTDTKSKDYDQLKDIPRPGHADYTAFVKYGGASDHRGGGHFSGRLTAPLCFAGAICLQILERRGIAIGAHILSIKDIRDSSFDSSLVTAEELTVIAEKEFPVIDGQAGVRMRERIEEARLEADSVGGIIECFAVGVPAGIGEPMFDGVENRLAAAIFAIPAVKGVEFGAGFEAASMMGSKHNDEFVLDEPVLCDPVCASQSQEEYAVKLKTKTNNHGGVLGGISSGMPIVLRVAFKPTPSIGKVQSSVSLSQQRTRELKVEGRHDPCIVPRAVPCVEAAVAIQLLDLLELK